MLVLFYICISVSSRIINSVVIMHKCKSIQKFVHKQVFMYTIGKANDYCQKSLRKLQFII